MGKTIIAKKDQWQVVRYESHNKIRIRIERIENGQVH